MSAIDHLYNWLAILELSQYYDNFTHYNITYDLLPSIDKTTLKEIGIHKIGDIIKLQNAINNIKISSLSIKVSSLIEQKPLVPNSIITVILQDGSINKFNITNCLNIDSIKQRILSNLPLLNCDNYIIDQKDNPHLLFDIELVSLCHSQQDFKFILCPPGESPSSMSISTFHKIDSSFLKKKSITQTTSNDSQLKKFFGQRPTSELISNNLLEYFPNSKINDLQNTVRNSVRMSRLINNPTLLQRPLSIVSNSNRILLEETLISKRLSIVSSNRTSNLNLFDDDDDEIDESILSQLSLEEETGPQNWLKGSKIGSGSFGTVYLGMNSLTGELMAVKQVPILRHDSGNHDMLMIDALKQEMSLLRNLQHENIVQYIGSNVDSNFLNIFIEYVPGGSVTTMLNNYGPFEEPLIRNFIRQILIGLNYLHGEHIIHRDIKGANVLIDIKGTVKISDFGISKKINNNDQSNVNKRSSLQGSVYWMAPEVVKQTAYTPKLDIWSVGCLVIEMFTGKHPFPDFSQMQLIFKIGTHTKPAIPAWSTDELKLFLNRVFELDYLKRPSLEELLKDDFLNTLILSKN